MYPQSRATLLWSTNAKWLATAFVALNFPLAQAIAGETLLLPSQEPASEDQQGFSDRVDFAWGIAVNSNYISDGLTQSADRPAMQGYGELSSGIVYSGVWLSTVDLDGDTAEIDFYAGIRPQFGPLAVDIAYTRYFFDVSGNCCGVWTGKADIAASDAITINWQADIDPQSEIATIAVGATFELAEKLGFSWTVHENLDDFATDWNAGLTWSMTDTASVDFRYHGSELYEERYVVTLAYDFSTAR